LIGRKEDVPDAASVISEHEVYDDYHHNPAILSYLPFSRSIFDLMVDEFHVHGTGVRTLTRKQAIFTRIYVKDEQGREAIGK
jgi:hypothetical protein